MPLLPGFASGFYKALSPTMGVDTAINIYTETREVPGSAKQTTLYGTPGRVLDGTAGTGPARGAFTQDGRTWEVSGDALYERTAPGVYVSRGTILNDGLPVSITSNGSGGDQLGIVGGGKVYYLDLTTNVLAETVLPFSNPVMITFLDGYGLVNERDTAKVWFSALEDFSLFDALDFFTRSGTSDNLVGITVSRDRVWCLGSKTSTLFYNSGDSDTPFVPYPGTAIQVGLVAPWLLNVYNDTLFWVAKSAKGQYRVVAASESQPQDISTPPIDQFLANCSSLLDAEMLVYEQEKHLFVAITCPSSSDAVQTYVYDASENMWHARAGWDDTQGAYTRWAARSVTSTVEGTILVGDYNSGNYYALSLSEYTDAEEVLRRERTTPYFSQENQWAFLDQAELLAQVGVGLNSDQGVAPVATLELSRDAGQTWVNAGNATLGAMGQYVARCIWRMLGRARMDRLVLRVTQTDPVKTAWTGLSVRLTLGTGQL